MYFNYILILILKLYTVIAVKLSEIDNNFWRNNHTAVDIILIIVELWGSNCQQIK